MPKCKTLAVKEKASIIDAVRDGTCSKKCMACQLGVPPSALSTILGSKDILTEYSRTYSSKHSWVRASDFPDTEKAVTSWVNKMTAANLPENGTILRDQACQLADILGYKDFKCSNEWLFRFKERHNLTYPKVCSESGSVDNWKPRTLKPILDGYFWCQLLPWVDPDKWLCAPLPWTVSSCTIKV